MFWNETYKYENNNLDGVENDNKKTSCYTTT